MITFTSRNPGGAAAQTPLNTRWTLVRQQEDGLFEGLSPPGDSQGGFLTSGMSLENTIKDKYKHTESKHRFDRGVGS